VAFRFAEEQMKKSGASTRWQRGGSRKNDVTSADGLPFEASIGYQVRATHRLLQRYLQIKIEPFRITTGIWYFLRALWHEDGLTQRELSLRIGTAEPTTLNAIKSMEALGLVRRVRSTQDRRKLHVWLTPKAKKLESHLIPLARSVVETAAATLTAAQVNQLLTLLPAVQRNLNAAIDRGDRKKTRMPAPVQTY
jgi:MarR family transcriptional regulator, organic hydroperoxide resistance regulator